MSTDKLENKLLVNFPRKISRDEAFNLFTFIARELPGNVSYVQEQRGDIGHKAWEQPISLSKIPVRQSFGDFRGSISCAGAFDSLDYQMRPSYDDQDRQIFETLELGVPATDPDEYNDRQRKLVSDINNVIAQYFSENAIDS
jgi:hypothetical protein